MEAAEKACKLLEKLFAIAIEKIETIIDEELEQSHQSIAKEIQSSFDSVVKKLNYLPSSSQLLAVQVQSGGNFDPE